MRAVSETENTCKMELANTNVITCCICLRCRELVRTYIFDKAICRPHFMLRGMWGGRIEHLKILVFKLLETIKLINSFTF